MGTHCQLDRQVAHAKHLHWPALTAQDALRVELLRTDRAALGEPVQVADVHFAEGDAERIGKAAAIGQLANQRQLTTLEVGWHATAGAGILPLGALAASFDPAAAVATTDPAAFASAALGRL